MSSDLLSKRSAEEHNRDPPYPLKDSRSEEEPKKEQEEDPVETLSEKKFKQTWARLIKNVFEVDLIYMDALVSAKPWIARADYLSVLNVVLRWLCWN